MSLLNLLPKEINGWKVHETDRIYDRQSLFQYIDGGAEVYLTYRFQNVLVRTFEKKKEPDMTVEIFDMKSPEEAFGIFTFEREGEDVGIGQGSEYADGLLRFWKDHFFISISTEQETESSKRTIFQLGRILDQVLKKRSELGFFVKGDFLPPEGLLWNEMRFFHKAFNLNYHYFVSDENILNLNEETQAILAPYLINKDKCYLLAVKYTSPARAKQSYDFFMNAFMPESREKGLLLMENNKWTAGIIIKKFLLIIFDAPSQKFARKILEKAKRNLEDE